MLDKLTSIEHRYTELASLLGEPAVQGDPSEYRKHARALADIEPTVERFREYKHVAAELDQAQELARSGDAEMRALA